MTMIMKINILKALYIIKGQNKHLNICIAITVFLHNMLKRIKELNKIQRQNQLSKYQQK